MFRTKNKNCLQGTRSCTGFAQTTSEPCDRQRAHAPSSNPGASSSVMAGSCSRSKSKHHWHTPPLWQCLAFWGTVF